jgi:hypothetical protein
MYPHEISLPACVFYVVSFVKLLCKVTYVVSVFPTTSVRLWCSWIQFSLSTFIPGSFHILVDLLYFLPLHSSSILLTLIYYIKIAQNLHHEVDIGTTHWAYTDFTSYIQFICWRWAIKLNFSSEVFRLIATLLKEFYFQTQTQRASFLRLPDLHEVIRNLGTEFDTIISETSGAYCKSRWIGFIFWKNMNFSIQKEDCRKYVRILTYVIYMVFLQRNTIILSTKRWDLNLRMVAHACYPSYVGDVGRMVVQVWHKQKSWDPIWKVTKEERAEGMA